MNHPIFVPHLAWTPTSNKSSRTVVVWARPMSIVSSRTLPRKTKGTKAGDALERVWNHLPPHCIALVGPFQLHSTTHLQLHHINWSDSIFICCIILCYCPSIMSVSSWFCGGIMVACCQWDLHLMFIVVYWIIESMYFKIWHHFQMCCLSWKWWLTYLDGFYSESGARSVMEIFDDPNPINCRIGQFPDTYIVESLDWPSSYSSLMVVFCMVVTL